MEQDGDKMVGYTMGLDMRVLFITILLGLSLIRTIAQETIESASTLFLNETESIDYAKFLPEKVSFDTLRVDTYNYVYGYIKLYYEDGYKRKAELFSIEGNLKQVHMLNETHPLQFVRYDSLGLIETVFSYNDTVSRFGVTFKNNTAIVSTHSCKGGSLGDLEINKFGIITSSVKVLPDSELEFTDHYDNGVLSQTYISSQEPTKYVNYFPNGTLFSEGMIVFSPWNRLSKWKEYYKSGAVFRIYQYSEIVPNQKEGKWKWFDEEGNLIKWEEYNEGTLISNSETED